MEDLHEGVGVRYRQRVDEEVAGTRTEPLAVDGELIHDIGKLEEDALRAGHRVQHGAKQMPLTTSRCPRWSRTCQSRRPRARRRCTRRTSGRCKQIPFGSSVAIFTWPGIPAPIPAVVLAAVVACRRRECPAPAVQTIA